MLSKADRDRIEEIRADLDRIEYWRVETRRAIIDLLSVIDRLRADGARYRWRPISEIHEDLGEVVMINIHNPGNMELGSSLDHEFCETDWTHFSQIAPLSQEEATDLRAVEELAGSVPDRRNPIVGEGISYELCEAGPHAPVETRNQMVNEDSATTITRLTAKLADAKALAEADYRVVGEKRALQSDHDITYADWLRALKQAEAAESELTNLRAAHDLACVDLVRAEKERDALRRDLADQQMNPVKWVCFHCGFETSNSGEAEAHFGERDDTQEFTPTCIWWSKLSAEARIQEFQDLRQQLNAEQIECGSQNIKIEGLEFRLLEFENLLGSRFKGCKSINDAFNLYDSMEGRALAAEADARRLRRALSDVTPSHRAPGCWCSRGRYTDKYGHEQPCLNARAAIADPSK